MTPARMLVLTVTVAAVLGALAATVGLLFGFNDQYAFAERTERGWAITQGLSPALLVFFGGALVGGALFGGIGWAAGSRVWLMFSYTEDATANAMRADLAVQLAEIESERMLMIKRIADARETTLQSMYDSAHAREQTLQTTRKALAQANSAIEKLQGQLRGAQGKAKRLKGKVST